DFFFQSEDGIRYRNVTGVQTCALPITRILQTFRKENLGRSRIHFGDINVEEVISMYKKLQFHNHQNLGYASLVRPLRKDYDTESTWIHIPENVTRVYRNLLVPAKSGEIGRAHV